MKTDLSPTQDEKLMSALANAVIILPMWGIIASALIWITQREKSAYVRDQALQALSWQVTQVGAMFLGMACYFVSFFAMFGTMFAAEGQEMVGPPPFFFLPFCAMGFIFLAMFGFIVVGLYAAFRNLQGHVFTYPLVGVRARAYINK
ncbi:MAG: DUF4870 domain-containing protein [Anaerolineae bacterium]|nr:DUF4870 domain-containing protein [Anaerolineae bacterium]